jgi:hypothetical protein
MTILEQLQTIKDKIIRQQAVHNILIQHNKTIYGRFINKNRLINIVDDGLNYFTWIKTEQGPDYWFKLHNNITKT